MHSVRRLASMLLLAVFTLPLLLPMLAYGQGEDAGLPACCRREGKHHCGMSMAEKSRLAFASGQGLRWRAPQERCPYCPASVAAGRIHDVFAAPPAQAIYAEVASHPAGRVQVESKWRIARERSRQKRGPPSLQS